MTRPILIPLILSLAACGGLKTVDPEILVEIDATAMEPILEEQQDLERARADLDALGDRRSELKQLLKSAESNAEHAETDVSETEDAKVAAVRSGDTSSVEELDGTIAATEGVYQAKQERADRLTQEMDVLEKRIDAGEIRVDLAAAELELARAKAAETSGATVDTEPFMRQVDDLTADYAKAMEAVEAARTSTDD